MFIRKPSVQIGFWEATVSSHMLCLALQVCLLRVYQTIHAACLLFFQKKKYAPEDTVYRKFI